MEVEVNVSVSTGILDTAQVSWTMPRYEKTVFSMVTANRAAFSPD